MEIQPQLKVPDTMGQTDLESLLLSTCVRFTLGTNKTCLTLALKSLSDPGHPAKVYVWFPEGDKAGGGIFCSVA
jgi:hypothetical protein